MQPGSYSKSYFVFELIFRHFDFCQDDSAVTQPLETLSQRSPYGHSDANHFALIHRRCLYGQAISLLDKGYPSMSGCSCYDVRHCHDFEKRYLGESHVLIEYRRAGKTRG